MKSLIEISKNILTDCMGLKADETLLVITDTLKYEIGKALYEAGLELGCESLLMSMQVRSVSGEEPPEAVANAMLAADVIVCPTEESLTHTNAKIQAVKNGARVGTMPGITEEMFTKGAITADFKEVERRTLELTQMLTAANEAVIIKDNFTMRLNLQDRKGVPSTGVYKNQGSSGNLPSGEAYIAPQEDGCDGEILIDGSMVGVGTLTSPLHVTVKNGVLQTITGSGSEKLDILFAKPENSIVAELGIGTNEKAILCGNTLEDEKVYGTVHIAFGTNTSFGGKNKADCHMDGIILNPTLYLDNKKIIEKGEFVY
ncbi:aminopeptidase [Ihubacter sp. mB4P-1]|uniref:aminopeptidase n=1 Tax=Ihubacter sp. mB4P-1 TaxID=3242370 RepID=UPI00137B116B